MRRVGIHQIQNPQSIFDCGKAFGVPAAPVGRTTAAHGERGNRVVSDLGLTVDPVRHREGRGGGGARVVCCRLSDAIFLGTVETAKR